MSATVNGTLMTEPRRVDRFLLLERLGSGGVAEVYRARDEQLDREVAVKFAKPAALATPEGRERFRREARLAARLRHPNVAAVHDAHIDAPEPFLVQELVPGDDLRSLINKGALPASRCIDIARQLAAALEHVHAAGLVHRDVKPANVRIGPDGIVKLIDFSLARPADATEDELLVPGGALGTRGYAAPEVLFGAPATPAADMYSFGATVQRMTGAPPHLLELASRCRSEDPHDRPTAADVLRELQTPGGGGAASLSTEPPELRRFMSGSRPIDLDGIDWEAIPRYRMPEDVLRILIYMQDVESHTVVFPRTIFSKRALEDEQVGPFLICWLYEEGMHGRALAKFLHCAGHPVPPRRSERTTLRDRIDRTMTRMLSAGWKDFVTLHMAWGAVHECTTIQAYRRLMEQNDHPILNELLRRIVRDEARHFAFYMWQARERLAKPGVARKVRAIMDRFYTPVGASHHPDALACWVSGFLFDGESGRKAARHVDQSIATLPGFADAALLTGWLERNVYAPKG